MVSKQKVVSQKTSKRLGGWERLSLDVFVPVAKRKSKTLCLVKNLIIFVILLFLLAVQVVRMGGYESMD